MIQKTRCWFFVGFQEPFPSTKSTWKRMKKNKQYQLVINPSFAQIFATQKRVDCSLKTAVADTACRSVSENASRYARYCRMPENVPRLLEAMSNDLFLPDNSAHFRNVIQTPVTIFKQNTHKMPKNMGHIFCVLFPSKKTSSFRPRCGAKAAPTVPCRPKPRAPWGPSSAPGRETTRFER